jgi:methylthioribose-1-phosphate isomerase
VLEILDQRRLPTSEVWLRCETVDDVVDAIGQLAIRGAPAIGIAAAYGLALAVSGAAPHERRERFEVACERLAATRPTAVNLAWALERARHACEPDADSLRAHAEALLAAQEAADAQIAVHGAALFAAGDRVLTHCNSGPLATGGQGTAGGVIAAAWSTGRLAHVWIDETRPLLQGARLTAWELSQAGVPHSLVTDSSVGRLMAAGLVDRVIVGADRIAANGDVANKIGSYTIAVVAARHGIPFYVAAPTSTIDHATPTGAEVPIEERPAEEVTTFAGSTVAPVGTQARNWAFDITPAELVSAIITEFGVLEPPLEEAITRAGA